ncbi:uncharacterized protein METZ01_LOCUS84499 [marine metagenome]|uniref:Uncharacterized protein n=1 Tax=marine metagenome TaxID=408172 RepID=A0A381UU09_9ZZZZ
MGSPNLTIIPQKKAPSLNEAFYQETWY